MGIIRNQIVEDVAVEALAASLDAVDKAGKKIKEFNNRPRKVKEKENYVELPFTFIMRVKKTGIGHQYIYYDEQGNAKYYATKVSGKHTWELRDPTGYCVGSVIKSKTPVSECYLLICLNEEIGMITRPIIGTFKLKMQYANLDLHSRPLKNAYFVQSADSDDDLIRMVWYNGDQLTPIKNKFVIYPRNLAVRIEYASPKEELLSILLTQALEYDRVTLRKRDNRMTG